MTTVVAAGTYVQISREELEDWLNSIGFSGKWDRDPRYKGIYLLKLGPAVAVKLSSTIGSDDDAKGRGKASMQLSLVSTVTGRVLNKKAQGQDHFKRTLGWKKTWAAGIDTMKKAYLSSADFYDAIAVIEDREAYKINILKDIETIPGWDNDSNLLRLYRKIENNGVLMGYELALITEAKKRPAPKTPDPQRIEPSQSGGEGVTHTSPDQAQEQKMQALRQLWLFAKRAKEEALQRGDERAAKNHLWTMTFAQSLATEYVGNGRRLTERQLNTASEKLSQYRIVLPNGKPAYELF